MRVTESKMKLITLAAMRSTQDENAAAQSKLASGKEIYKPSDDPQRFVTSARLKSVVKSHDQYLRNISDAKRFIDNSETAVTKIVSLLQETRMLMVRASNETFTTTDLQLMGDEMRQQLDGLIQFANSDTVDGKIFGGTKTDVNPFEVKRDSDGNIIDVIYRGNRTKMKRTISEDSTIDVNYIGSELFQVDKDWMESSAGASVNPILAPDEKLSAYFTNQEPKQGYFTVQDKRVWFDIENDSLNDIAARINDKVPEANATVETPVGGSGYRLRIETKNEDQLIIKDEGAGRFFERMQMTDGTANSPANMGSGNQNDLSLFNVIINTIGNLERGEYSEISNTRIAELSRGLDRMDKVIGEIGGQAARLENTESRVKDILYLSKKSISENEDLEYGEAITRLRMSEFKLQLAISAAQNAPGQNLLKFL